MDLSLATIDQIDAELSRREIPFSLIVSAKSAEESHAEEPKYVPAPFVAAYSRSASVPLPAWHADGSGIDGRGS